MILPPCKVSHDPEEDQHHHHGNKQSFHKILFALIVRVDLDSRQPSAVSGQPDKESHQLSAVSRQLDKDK
jgi:hypothetical protein